MISLITSIYKSDKYIENFSKNVKECFNSLLNQGIQAELIIIANDPSEYENKVLEELSRYSFIRQITVSKETLSRSWNRGVMQARGDVIGFWNIQDDRLPEAIIDAAKLIKQGASLVYFPYVKRVYLEILGYRIKVFKKSIKSIYNPQSFFNSMIYGPHFMFSKELYNFVGPFDEQFSIAGDFEWCLRAVYHGAVVKLSENISGFNCSRVRKLSRKEYTRLLVEENVIYTRYGLWDKLTIVDNVLMHTYNPHRRRYNDQNILCHTWLPQECATYIKTRILHLV